MKTTNCKRILIGALICICLCMMLPTAAIAQAPGKRTKYLMFKVTVKGNGKTSDGVIWTVDRTYESNGLVELQSSPAPLLEPGMSGSDIKIEMIEAAKGGRWATYRMPLKITINDSYRLTTTDRCPSPDGGYYETTVVTRTWTGTDVISVGMTTGLKMTFPTLPTEKGELSGEAHYNVLIPLIGLPTASKALTYTESKEITRKAPTKVIELRTMGTVEIPDVEGVLWSSSIHHAKQPALDILGNEIIFDSGLLPPLKPVMEGVKESIGGVNVHVAYRIKGTAFTSISGK